MFDFFFFQAEDGIRDYKVTGVQTCALPISAGSGSATPRRPVRNRRARIPPSRGRPSPPFPPPGPGSNRKWKCPRGASHSPDLNVSGKSPPCKGVDTSQAGKVPEQPSFVACCFGGTDGRLPSSVNQPPVCPARTAQPGQLPPPRFAIPAAQPNGLSRCSAVLCRAPAEFQRFAQLSRPAVPCTYASCRWQTCG